MKKKDPRSHLAMPVLALALAALGQSFLSQRDLPWTLGAGATCFALAGACLFFIREPRETKPRPLPAPWEWGLLAAILLLALFLRAWRLDQFPAGLFTDEACEGWGALRILKEGWRPFAETYGLAVIDPSVYYVLAFWFKFFPATQPSLFSASVFLSLLALPFLYRAFRRLTGPRAALIGLFLIAVLRWHLTYSRDMHPAIEILVYLGAALALWLYAVDSGRTWAFALAGVPFGLGFYSYQAYRPFGLVLALAAAFELWTRPRDRKGLAARMGLFFGLGFLIALPAALRLLSTGGLDERDRGLAAFPGLLSTGGLTGVLDHIARFALAFNRRGDEWPVHNIPGHALLDGVTGTLFVLGTAWALLHLRRRASFYALAGIGAMSLPAFLSTTPEHASRLFGTIPFIALLAADLLQALLSRLEGSFPQKRAWWTGALALGLGLGLAQNAHDYFGVQAKNTDCWEAEGGAAASWIGKKIVEDGGRCSYLLCSHYFGSYALMFLGFGERDRMYPWSLSQGLERAGLPKDRGLCFFFEEGQTGQLQMVECLYPGGALETFRSPGGYPIAYQYRLPAFPAHPQVPGDWGLTGEYFGSRMDWAAPAKPALTHRDLLLNFTFRNDFPIKDFPPLSVEWTGSLLVPRAGVYRFLILTTDGGRMGLDGMDLLSQGNRESSDVSLRPGPHRLDVFFWKDSGENTAFTLLWKRPGEERYEVIPSNVFRTKFP